MSGHYLRHAKPRYKHTCSPPEVSRDGDVWRCDCGRRWLCIGSSVETSAMRLTATWQRRYLPWPWDRAAHQ